MEKTGLDDQNAPYNPWMSGVVCRQAIPHYLAQGDFSDTEAGAKI